MVFMLFSYVVLRPVAAVSTMTQWRQAHRPEKDTGRATVSYRFALEASRAAGSRADAGRWPLGLGHVVQRVRRQSPIWRAQPRARALPGRAAAPPAPPRERFCRHPRAG